MQHLIVLNFFYFLNQKGRYLSAKKDISKVNAYLSGSSQNFGRKGLSANLSKINFELKSKMDQENPAVIAWEKLMSTFQQPLPYARENEKWVLGKQIFKL